MDMMYATLLLHSEKQAINEDNLKKVLTAAGATVNETKVKAAVAALEGVNIEDAISKAAVSAAPVAATEPAKEEKEEDTEAKAEEAAAGLGALFG